MLADFDVDMAVVDPTSEPASVFLEPTEYVAPVLLLAGQALLFIFLLSVLVGSLAAKYASLVVRAEEAWRVEWLRLVREYKDERDVLPPPLNALVLVVYDFPSLFANMIISRFGKRVQPGDDDVELVDATPRPAHGLKLKVTLPRHTIEQLAVLACRCRDRSMASGGGDADGSKGRGVLGSDDGSRESLHLATVLSRLDTLDGANKRHDKLLHAIIGAEPHELLELRQADSSATKLALHALHQASSTKLPPLPKKHGTPSSCLAAMPTLSAASAPPSAQIVYGSSLVPVHRVGPRLPSGAKEPASVTPVDEQLGHLITPDIYRAFCLYGDKSFSGISVADKGAQLRLAIQHAAPGLRLGVMAEQLVERCVRASHLRVGLQAFGKLMRDLTALHRQQEPAMDGVSSVTASLGPEATLRAQQIFRRHDRDASGDIDTSELRPVLRELGLDASNAQVESIMRRYECAAATTLRAAALFSPPRRARSRALIARLLPLSTRLDSTCRPSAPSHRTACAPPLHAAPTAMAASTSMNSSSSC